MPGDPLSRLLSSSDLAARRVAARRRRRRRRIAAVLVLAVACAAAVLVALRLSGTGSPPRRVAALAPPPPRAVRRIPRRRPRPVSHREADTAAVQRVLGYTSYVQVAGDRARDVALTFDDGPGPYTPRILAVLQRMHVPATFFVIGRSARAYPRLVAAEVKAGCVVGDHTEDHPPLGVLSPARQANEIAAAAGAIRAAGAPSPLLMRPPYGSFNAATLEVLRAERMLMVLWSADTEDYTRPGVRRIIYTAVSGGRPGAIILMHDGGGDRSQTVAALPRIITRLRQRGFRLVTVSQLLADDPPPAHQPPPVPLSGTV